MTQTKPAPHRAAGILLHPTSLPGPFGVGDLGPTAYAWIETLVQSKQKWWQILPLGPTGYGDSPYQCFSAFAGNPLLISPELLVTERLLSADDLEVFEGLSADKVDYPRVGQLKLPLLRKAYQEFKVKSADKKAFNEFKQCHHDWLEDFALFMALKDAHNGIAWVRWEREFVRRDADALQRARQQFSEEIETHNFAQYVFFKQWTQLRQHCIDRRIRIMGDLPIYVAHDSADVWANPEFFLLDENGNPKKIAGVPPDYFSASGQLWGNPIHRDQVFGRTIIHETSSPTQELMITIRLWAGGRVPERRVRVLSKTCDTSESTRAST